jgi:hypothetical protein
VPFEVGIGSQSACPACAVRLWGQKPTTRMQLFDRFRFHGHWPAFSIKGVFQIFFAPGLGRRSEFYLVFGCERRSASTREKGVGGERGDHHGNRGWICSKLMDRR